MNDDERGSTINGGSFLLFHHVWWCDMHRDFYAKIFHFSEVCTVQLESVSSVSQTQRNEVFAFFRAS
jgi:hypothetical protein